MRTLDRSPQLHDPRALLELPSGHVLVADAGSHTVRTLEPGLQYITTAVTNPKLHHGGGGGTEKGSKAGARLQLRSPSGLALSPSGEVVICDSGNHRLVVASLEPAPERRAKGKGGATAPGGLVVSRWAALLGSATVDDDLGRVQKVRAADTEAVYSETGGIGSWRVRAAGQVESPAAIVALPGGEGFLVSDRYGLRFVSWPEGHVVTVRCLGRRRGGKAGAAKPPAAATSAITLNGDEPTLGDISGLCLDGDGCLVIADPTVGLLRLTPSKPLRPRPAVSKGTEHPWGHRRWLSGSLELLAGKAEGKEASRGGFVDDRRPKTPTVRCALGVSPLDGGLSVLVSEQHCLRRLHSRRALANAAEAYRKLEGPLHELTAELKREAEAAAEAYRCLDVAFEAGRRLHERAVADLLGLVFRRRLADAAAAIGASMKGAGGAGDDVRNGDVVGLPAGVAAALVGAAIAAAPSAADLPATCLALWPSLRTDERRAAQRSLAQRLGSTRWSPSPAAQALDADALARLAGGGDAVAGEALVSVEAVLEVLAAAPASGLVLSPFRGPLTRLVGCLLGRCRAAAAAPEAPSQMSGGKQQHGRGGDGVRTEASLTEDALEAGFARYAMRWVALVAENGAGSGAGSGSSGGSALAEAADGAASWEFALEGLLLHSARLHCDPLEPEPEPIPVALATALAAGASATGASATGASASAGASSAAAAAASVVPADGRWATDDEGAAWVLRASFRWHGGVASDGAEAAQHRLRVLAWLRSPRAPPALASAAPAALAALHDLVVAAALGCGSSPSLWEMLWTDKPVAAAQAANAAANTAPRPYGGSTGNPAVAAVVEVPLRCRNLCSAARRLLHAASAATVDAALERTLGGDGRSWRARALLDLNDLMAGRGAAQERGLWPVLAVWVAREGGLVMAAAAAAADSMAFRPATAAGGATQQQQQLWWKAAAWAKVQHAGGLVSDAFVDAAAKLRSGSITVGLLDALNGNARGVAKAWAAALGDDSEEAKLHAALVDTVRDEEKARRHGLLAPRWPHARHRHLLLHLV